MIKKTTQIGDKVLRTKARSVKQVSSPQVRAMVKNLTDSMRAHELVGMAAPQIGVGLRVFVTEIRKTKQRKNVDQEDPLRVFINPKLISKSKKIVAGYEGCGSVAPTDGLFALVPRPESVTVSAYNEEGKAFTLTAKGLLARVIQHELDHLDGVLFLDRVTHTKSFIDRRHRVRGR